MCLISLRPELIGYAVDFFLKDPEVGVKLSCVVLNGVVVSYGAAFSGEYEEISGVESVFDGDVHDV